MRVASRKVKIVGLVCLAALTAYLLWNYLFDETRLALRLAEKAGLVIAPRTVVRAQVFYPSWVRRVCIELKCTSDELQEFLSQSSSGIGSRPRMVYTPSHMFLLKDSSYDVDLPHKYYGAGTFPEWMRPDIRTSGREFYVTYDNKSIRVIVNDTDGNVYISLGYD